MLAMSYILYGSQTSPFVRRLRLLMEDIAFELHEMDIFSAKDAELLNKINPLNQVPALADGETIILDSRQIYHYLNSIHHLEKTSLNNENLLSIIEGAMDSAITLLMMKRSNMPVSDEFMFVRRQKERLSSALDYLKPLLLEGEFNDWDFKAMSLYSFLDWAVFRGIIDLANRPECLSFLERFHSRDAVLQTQIPRT